MKRGTRFKVGSVFGLALLAAPSAAVAADIAGGTVWFNTSGNPIEYDSSIFRGPSGGRAQVCGDVQNSRSAAVTPIGLVRDVQFAPDIVIVQRSIPGNAATLCTNYGGTSTNQGYYTKVLPYFPDVYGGWASART